MAANKSDHSAARRKAGRKGRKASPWGRAPMVRTQDNDQRMERWEKGKS